MNILEIITKSIYSPVGVIKCKKNKERFIAGNIIFLSSCIINAFIVPIIYYLYFESKYDIDLDAAKMVLAFFMCIVTFILECVMFWSVSIYLKKNTLFKEIAASWSMSLIPNIFCVIVYLISSIFNSIIIGSSILMLVLNTVYIMLLIWKAIYYFIEVNLVLKLNGTETMVATILIGIGIFLLMFAGFRAGIQVPVV